jgi:hypothetical protein
MVSRPGPVLLAGCLLAMGAGCTSTPESGPRPTAVQASVTLPVLTVLPVPARTTPDTAVLEQALTPTSDGVADGLNALGAVPRFAPYEVTRLAVLLCEAGYSAMAVENDLQRRLLVRTSAVLVPAARLLGLAQAQCSRPATVTESLAYHRDVSALRNLGVGAPTRGPGLLSAAAQEDVCAVLGTDVAGEVLEGVVTSVTGALTRGRVRFAEPSDVLALVVEAATTSCPLWLAPASRALEDAS